MNIGGANQNANQYKQKTNKEYNSKKINQLMNIAKYATLAMGITIGGWYLANKSQPDIQVMNGPKGYELMNHTIPTEGRVSKIFLGKDTLNTDMNITRENGKITYEGPIKYEISNPRSPVPSDADITRNMARDTRQGTVTLKSIDDKL